MLGKTARLRARIAELERKRDAAIEQREAQNLKLIGLRRIRGLRSPAPDHSAVSGPLGGEKHRKLAAGFLTRAAGESLDPK
jgi:hypothetical protein